MNIYFILCCSKMDRVNRQNCFNPDNKINYLFCNQYFWMDKNWSCFSCSLPRTKVNKVKTNQACSISLSVIDFINNVKSLWKQTNQAERDLNYSLTKTFVRNRRQQNTGRFLLQWKMVNDLQWWRMQKNFKVFTLGQDGKVLGQTCFPKFECYFINVPEKKNDFFSF